MKRKALSVHNALQFPLKQISSGSGTPSPIPSPNFSLTNTTPKPIVTTTTTTTQSNTSESSYMNSPTDDIVYLSLLNNIHEKKLISILNKEHIIYDSLLKVYSRYIKEYIHIAGILTQKYLYLTSAVKYQIWQQLRERTKIERIINAQNHNENTNIDRETASQLVHNLDLIDDDDLIQTKIMPFFIGKTKLQIKLEIILHRNNITSLSSLFGLNNDMTTNDMKYVLIGSEYRNELIDYILLDIPYIDEERLDDTSMVITLQRYFPNYLIDILNDKQSEYFVEHKESNTNTLNIERYNGYDIDYVQFMKSEIKYIDLRVFNMIDSENIQDIKPAFIMKNNSKSMIIFTLNNNNVRFEWITHIDYAINGEMKDNEDMEPIKYQKADRGKNKLLNDFTYNTNKKQKHFHRNYTFGERFNYYEKHLENSVIPIYKTLKDELLHNTIHKLPQKEYYWLYEECLKVQKHRGYRMRAYEGKYWIKKDAMISINHLISIKLYTDYSTIVKEFKKMCMKLHENETLQDVTSRNCEIANWCRYLSESCMVYGVQSKKKLYLYTALNKKLIFNSMRVVFESPLSTTVNAGIAQDFCTKDGIVLQFKANITETRFFDCSWLSHYKKEKERLVMGSTLKITGIWLNGVWHKKYVAALLMFEQIMNGYFVVNWKKETEFYLYVLIAYRLGWDGEYIEQPPQYFVVLFDNMIQRMKRQSWCNTLWINNEELMKIEHDKLRCLLCGCCDFFDEMEIVYEDINRVHLFEWTIQGDEYETLRDLAPRQYIDSMEFEYVLDGVGTIGFQLKCCKTFSDEIEQCGIYLYLSDALPDGIDAINIEYDIICDYGKKYKYQHLMTSQWLNDEQNHCGFATFSNKMLHNATSITWSIALKVIDYDGEEAEDEINIQNVALALQNHNEDKVLEMFNKLMEESKLKEQELMAMKGDIHHIQQKSEELQKTYHILSSMQSNETLKQFQELVTMRTVNNDEEHKGSQVQLLTGTNSPTLSILRSYSREIEDSEAAAAITIESKIESQEEQKTNYDISRTVTYKSDRSLKSWKRPSKTSNEIKKKKHVTAADIVKYNVNTIHEQHHHHYHKGYNGYSNMKKVDEFRNNAMKRDNSGAYNIYYRSYFMKSPSKQSGKHYASIDTDYTPFTDTSKQSATITSWDKVTMNDDVDSDDMYDILPHGYRIDEDSLWDLSQESESILRHKSETSGFTESTLQQEIPQARTKMPAPKSRKKRSKMISNPFESKRNECKKTLPPGWTKTCTSSGMLIYLDHINKIATFYHPLHDSCRTSLRSNEATWDSNDLQGPI